MTSAVPWLTDAGCVLLCAAATASDLRTRRIPNRLNLAGFVLGLSLSFATRALAGGARAGLTEGLLPALAGAAGLFCAFLVVALVGAVGMGDVKLMGAVGAFLGWPLAYRVLVDVLLAGAALALVLALWRGELGAALRNLGRGAGSLVGRAVRPAGAELHPLPYALAILLGVTWTVLGRYAPSLRFP